MDVREKLVELIDDFIHNVDLNHWYSEELDEKLADYLIANGVTVQENCKACAEATQNCIVKLQEQIAELRSVQTWISVKDRLPTREDANETESILAISKDEKYVGRWIWDIVARWPDEFTYWMPIPQPPKGE